MAWFKAILLSSLALAVTAQDDFYGAPTAGAFNGDGFRSNQGSNSFSSTGSNQLSGSSSITFGGKTSGSAQSFSTSSFGTGSNIDSGFGGNIGFSGSSGVRTSNIGGGSSRGSSSSSNSFRGSSSSSNGFRGSSSGNFGGSSSNFDSSSSGNFGGSTSGNFGGSSSGSSSFRGSSGSSSSSFGSDQGNVNTGFSSGSSGSNFGGSSSSSSSNNFGGANSFSGDSFNRGSNQGRQGGQAIDFSQGTRRPDGKLCVTKEDVVETIAKDPVLECNHKNVEKCHYTYKTQFNPAQEEVCEENFEKNCQITFKQQAVTESVTKCYRPLVKICNGQGPEECRTVYESSCSTRYIEKQPGKFVGDTTCEKLPIEICGAGCVTEEGPEECHDKEVDSLVDVPEEVCDLNPQKTCRLQTKLVPSLKPEHECTIIPQETCNLRFSSPRKETKPLRSEWCLDDSPPIPDETYDERNAAAAPFGRR